MTTLQDLSPGRRRIAAVSIAVSVGIVATAQRDLHRRTAAGVKGSKLAWRVICLNAVGAPAYLLWGRWPANG